VEGRLLLDVVVGQGATIFKLLASKNQALLVRRDTLLVLNLGLDVVNRVRRLNLEGDGLSGQSFDDWSMLVHLDKNGQTGREMYLQICMPPRRRRTR
jgi:hypothetical protein